MINMIRHGIADQFLNAIFGVQLAHSIGSLSEARPPQAVVAVYVDPSATGQGVGRLILARAVDLARDGHSGPIRVQSTLNATSFYEHHGFVEVKRATVSRNQVEVPIVVMERHAG